MTRKEEAEKLTDDAKELNLLIGRSWVALASIYKRFVDDKLWRELGFTGFPEWLAAVGDKSESQAYAMAATYRDLSETIPEPALAQMTMANARDLAKLPAKDRTAELVEAGTKMPNNQYREALNKAKPGIALEQTKYKGFQLEESAHDMVMRAIALAKRLEGVESDSGALEVVCSHFLASEGQESHYDAAKATVETVEQQIDPENLSAPPDKKGWGQILTMVRRMSRVFGFRERRVMPKSEPVAASERVQ